MAKTRAEEILAKHKKARTKKQKREAIMKELDAFDRNQQWDLQSAPAWLPKPVTNFVHLVKYTKRAALAMDNPTGKLRPMSPAGKDMVEKLDKAFQFTWDRLKARKVVRANIETSKLLGPGFAHVYWDEYKEGRMGSTVQGDPGHRFEGDIQAKEIDPASFYPDPDAFTLEDCRYIGIMERKSMDWVKNHPKFKKTEDVTAGENNPEERGEIYHRDYTTESEGLVNFLSFYEKVPNAAGGYTYYVSYLANEKMLLDRQALKPNRYPFAMLSDFPQRQEFWPMSTCEFILDNQKIINKVESIIAMIGTLMQNPQKIVNSQSGVDPQEVAMYGNAPGHTYQANGDLSNSIRYVETPQIPQVLFSLLETAKANIREITGMNEAYMGQAIGSLQTSTGVNSLIERATMRDKDQMYDIELYIEDFSRLIIDFMVTYYDKPRMIRMMGTSPNEYSFEEFTGTDYADLEYDIAIDVSSKAPLTRLKEAQDAKELMNMQGQYQFSPPVITPQELIKKGNYSDADAIIERMNMDEMRNKVDEAMQVANMMNEAMLQGVEPQEVMQMGMSMFQQLDEQAKAGTGSTSNMNNVQMAQGGVQGM